MFFGIPSATSLFFRFYEPFSKKGLSAFCFSPDSQEPTFTFWLRPKAALCPLWRQKSAQKFVTNRLQCDILKLTDAVLS